MDEHVLDWLINEIVDLHFAGVSWRRAVVQIKLKYKIWKVGI